MMILVDSPTSFFYDLLQQSSREFDISLSEEVHVYLLNMLVESITNIERIDLEGSLSIKYLEAAQTRDLPVLKQVGDSCLFILGLFPTHRPEHNSLYYELGPTCFISLNKKVYNQLSIDFSRAVDLLLGVNLLLDRQNAYEIWQTTQSRMARKVLREQNVVPLRRF